MESQKNKVNGPVSITRNSVAPAPPCPIWDMGRVASLVVHVTN